MVKDCPTPFLFLRWLKVTRNLTGACGKILSRFRTVKCRPHCPGLTARPKSLTRLPLFAEDQSSRQLVLIAPRMRFFDSGGLSERLPSIRSISPTSWQGHQAGFAALHQYCAILGFSLIDEILNLFRNYVEYLISLAHCGPISLPGIEPQPGQTGPTSPRSLPFAVTLDCRPGKP